MVVRRQRQRRGADILGFLWGGGGGSDDGEREVCFNTICTQVCADSDVSVIGLHSE